MDGMFGELWAGIGGIFRSGEADFVRAALFYAVVFPCVWYRGNWRP